MDKRRLPADISALMDIGVDRWWAEASWPVSEGEFAVQVSALFAAYHTVLNGSNPGIRDILLVDIRFVGLLAQIFHTSLAQKRGLEQKCKVVYHDLARTFFEPDWDALSVQFCFLGQGGSSLKYRIREAIRRFRFNRHLSMSARGVAFFRPDGLWSVGVLSDNKVSYSKSPGRHFDMPYLTGLIDHLKVISDADKREITQAVDVFVSKLAKSNDLFPVAPTIFAAIAATWKKRLFDLLPVYQAVLSSSRPLKTVMCSEMGNPDNRIIALAAKRKGAEVIAFSHGNDPGHIEKIHEPYMDYSICTKYIAISKRSAELHAAHARNSGLMACHDTLFESSETEQYVNFLRDRTVQDGQNNRVVNAVLLAGFPMHAQRYIYGRGEYFPFRLGAELEIAKYLKASGMKVLYKPHPETDAVTSKIMRERVDEILTCSFEKALDRADCVVFTYPLTTTFGATLASDKPIVLLDHAGRNWNAEAREKLTRRCAMVPCDIDANGKLQLMSEKLIEAVKSSPSKLDHTYLLEYMAPANYEPA
jgi:hypothetical protein